MSIGRTTDVHRMSMCRFTLAGIALTFGVGLPPVDELPGVLIPVMQSQSIRHQPIQKADGDKRIDKGQWIAVPQRALRKIIGLIFCDLAILGEVERPPPETVQVPDHRRHRDAEQSSQSSRLWVTRHLLMRLYPCHANSPSPLCAFRATVILVSVI